MARQTMPRGAVRERMAMSFIRHMLPGELVKSAVRANRFRLFPSIWGIRHTKLYPSPAASPKQTNRTLLLIFPRQMMANHKSRHVAYAI